MGFYIFHLVILSPGMKKP